MRKNLTTTVMICIALLELTACEKRTTEVEQTEYQE